MRIGFISDLHLAAQPLNRCTTDLAVLLSDLQLMNQWADEIVVVGDAFDLLRPRKFRHWHAQLLMCQREYPELCALLQSLTCIYGNHDAHLKAQGWPEEWAWCADKMTLLAVHGHQSDQLIKRVPLVAEVGNYAAGWFERLEQPFLSHALSQVPDFLDRLKPSGKGGGVQRDRSLEYANVLHAAGWSIVAMGHSHALRLVADGHNLFINTGSHACHFRDYTLLDTETWCVQSIRDGDLFECASRTSDLQWSTGPCLDPVWVPFSR